MIDQILKPNKYTKILFLIIEFLLVYLFSFLIISFFYRDVVIKALHLDDLHNLLLYIKDPKITNWIFPFIENRMHYRPVFYIFLFKYFEMLGTDISQVVNFNFHIYSFVVSVVYFVCRSIKINRFLSFSAVIFLCIINFNYYEIYQVIGFIEGFTMMFSLIILSLSIKNLNADKKYFIFYSSFISIIYLLMVFTHERYFPIILIPILSGALNKKINNKTKIVFYITYIIEILFFFIIRFYHLGILVPRGTDSSNLIEKFDLGRSFLFIFHQIMYILGINLGPEYLCAVNINNADLDMIVLIILSALAVITTIVCYIIYSIKNKNNIFYKIDIRIDILFILYIFLCILQSSLTIRVELRFILSSFIGFFMYVSHMLMIVLREPIIPYYDMKKNLPRLTYIMLICFILFLASRISTSIYYKKCNEKIFLVNEQKVINGFYDATVSKYGVDVIKKKNILITSDNYKTFIDEEYTHFFDQFDRKISDRVIIQICTDTERLFYALSNDDDIILNEGLDYKFNEHIK